MLYDRRNECRTVECLPSPTPLPPQDDLVTSGSESEYETITDRTRLLGAVLRAEILLWSNPKHKCTEVFKVDCRCTACACDDNHYISPSLTLIAKPVGGEVPMRCPCMPLSHKHRKGSLLACRTDCCCNCADCRYDKLYVGCVVNCVCSVCDFGMCGCRVACGVKKTKSQLYVGVCRFTITILRGIVKDNPTMTLVKLGKLWKDTLDGMSFGPDKFFLRAKSKQKMCAILKLNNIQWHQAVCITTPRIVLTTDTSNA